MKQSDMTASGYPVYGANGQIGWYESYNHKEPTIVIGCRGTCGEINVCKPYSYVTSNGMCLDNLSTEIDSNYLVCFLKAYDFAKIIGGSSQPQITKKSISNILIPLPELNRQRHVSERLHLILDQISLLERMACKLDDLVKSRFVEMFGNARGEYRRLESCCEKIMSGKTPSMKHSEYYGGNIPFIKSGDVKEDVVSSGALWLSTEAIEKASVKLVPAGSVLVVVRSALLKRKVCTSICTRDVAINQDLRAFLPKAEFMSSYLLWSIRSQEQGLLNHVRSVNTSGLDIKQLYGLNIYVAPIAKQQEFANFVEQVDKLRFHVRADVESAM